jgi:15-cis-phytoene synthase
MDRARATAATATATAWVASQLASSTHAALGDDALKDFDNAGWVMELSPSIQPAWVQRIRAIRMADRLAENQQLDPASRRFDRVAAVSSGAPAPDDGLSHAFEGSGPAVLDAWNGYLEALRAYHRPDLRLASLADHRAMLERLSGSIFQLVPFLLPPHLEAIRGFGALDQFFNNLRDLAEDASHGICYFPEDVLARAGLRREDVLGDGWRSAAGWPRLVRLWLDEYLPALERGAAAFDALTDLHPSVERLRSECRARYGRILRVFRAVGFDFHRFAEEYWREVRASAERDETAAPDVTAA